MLVRDLPAIGEVAEGVPEKEAEGLCLAETGGKYESVPSETTSSLAFSGRGGGEASSERALSLRRFAR